MSSAKSKAISEIDLEEFERRLRVVRAPATLPNRAAAIAAATQDEEAPAHEYFAQAPLQAGDRINFARPPRRGSWYLKVAGLTAVSLLMVGGAVAMKIGMPGLHKSPPLILAADGPRKIAPPNEATVQSAGDTGALLLKDSAVPTVAPVKLVSTEQQPVDLLAQTPAPAPKPPAADEQSAPAPTTPIVAPSEGPGGAPASGRTLFPLISSDTAPDAPIPQSPAPAPSQAPVAPVRKPENAGAAALAATPTIDLPAKPAPKSSARMNIAKPATPAPANSANAPQLGLGTHAATGSRTADAIAMKLGIEKTAMIRLRAGISYALTEATDEGGRRTLHRPADAEALI